MKRNYVKDQIRPFLNPENDTEITDAGMIKALMDYIEASKIDITEEVRKEVNKRAADSDFQAGHDFALKALTQIKTF
jgi:hypothetical protein